MSHFRTETRVDKFIFNKQYIECDMKQFKRNVRGSFEAGLDNCCCLLDIDVLLVGRIKMLGKDVVAIISFYSGVLNAMSCVNGSRFYSR